jgi:hypothetical protein
VALPRLAQGARRALPISMAVVGATGLAAVGACLVAADFAVRVASGGVDKYADLADEIWLFAAAGAGWALVNLLLTARIAAGARWIAAPLWIAAVVEALAVFAWRPYSLTHTAMVALGTSLASVVVAIVLNRRAAPAARVTVPAEPAREPAGRPE